MICFEMYYLTACVTYVLALSRTSPALFLGAHFQLGMLTLHIEVNLLMFERGNMKHAVCISACLERKVTNKSTVCKLNHQEIKLRKA